MLDNEYVAGLFDTDGSVYVAFPSSKTPYISIKMGGCDHFYASGGVFHQWIEDVAQSNVKVYYEIERGGNRRNKYTYMLSSAKAMMFIDVIYPHSIVRKHLLNTSLDIVNNHKTFEDSKRRYAFEYQAYRFISHSESVFADYSILEHPAYLSGVFDGDGSVSIWNRPTRKLDGIESSITNWDTNMLKAVQRVFGGNLEKDKRKRYTHKLRFRVQETKQLTQFLLDNGYCHEKQAMLLQAHDRLKT